MQLLRDLHICEPGHSYRHFIRSLLTATPLGLWDPSKIGKTVINFAKMEEEEEMVINPFILQNYKDDEASPPLHNIWNGNPRGILITDPPPPLNETRNCQMKFVNQEEREPTGEDCLFWSRSFVTLAWYT